MKSYKFSYNYSGPGPLFGNWLGPEFGKAELFELLAALDLVGVGVGDFLTVGVGVVGVILTDWLLLLDLLEVVLPLSPTSVIPPLVSLLI